MTTSALPNDIVSNGRPKTQTREVVKRDGRKELFDQRKIVRGVQRCLMNALHRPEDEAESVGLQVAQAVANILKVRNNEVSIEDIQRLVIQQLWATNHFEAAEAYTLYRDKRRTAREQHPIPLEVARAVDEDRAHFPTDLQYYQFISKFARWHEAAGRRETWRETCDRVMSWFHRQPQILLEDSEWQELDASLYNMQATCAMRVIQMAGPALDRCNIGVFNCAYHPISDIFSLVELLYILMQGTGAGFSVESEYIDKLPKIKKQRTGKRALPIKKIKVEDSTEGWCEAYRIGLETWWDGGDVEFDVSGVRPAGARLKTKGGSASGSGPLLELLNFARSVLLKNQGGHLSDLDVHDLCCMTGRIVQVGGVRRASCISLSDLSSTAMRQAKSGNWYDKARWRTMANNSATYEERPDAVEFMEEWLALAQSMSGERGIFNRNAVLKQLPPRRKRWRFGCNPSLRKGTKVYTTEGIVPIETLANKEFYVRNLNGAVSRARCRLSGKNKQLYLLTLKGGHTYHATAEHEWPVVSRDASVTKHKTAELVAGMRLPILRFSSLDFGNSGTRDEGFLAGWLLGDGNVTVRTNNGIRQINMIVNEDDYASGIAAQLEASLRLIGSTAKFHGRERDGSTWYELCTQNQAINAWMDKFGLVGKQDGLPKATWAEASEEFRCGLIDGLFSADGTVDVSRRPGFATVSLSSAHTKLARDMADLLGFYGIKTTLEEVKRRDYSFPNGKEYDRKYTIYVLRISGSADVDHFAGLVCLTHRAKFAALSAVVGTHKPNYSANSVEVVSIEATDLFEDVWDIGVADETHCFQIAQCVTGNCAEIVLRPYECCNLTIAIARPDDTVESLVHKVRMATIFGTMQATCTNFGYIRPDWKANCEEERLLGVDITGHADCPLLRHDNPDRAKLLQRLKHEVAETNVKYAMRFGINRSAADTCVKPSGDSAVLFDCGSGVSPRFAAHQLRWVRESGVSPVTAFLKAEGVEWAPAPEDPSLCVFAFPKAAPAGSTLRNDLTAIQQLENWLEWKKHWAEHSVSCTVYVEPHEWFEVGNWVYEHFDEISGVSFLPKDNGNYKYAPNEEISKEEFDKRVAAFPKLNWSKLRRHESEDMTTGAQQFACTGDTCSLV